MTKHDEIVPTGVTVSYTSLKVKYIVLGAYGLAAAVIGVPTVFVVTGQVWGLVLPILMFLFANLAAVGVHRTQHGAPGKMEFIATLLLFATLCSYSLFIILRTFDDGDVTRLPAALFPVALSILPFSRMSDLARKAS